MKQKERPTIMKMTYQLPGEFFSEESNLEMEKGQCPELKNKLDHLIDQTGLFNSNEDQRNIGELIRRLQQQEVSCLTLERKLNAAYAKQLLILERDPEKSKLSVYIAPTIKKELAADPE